MRNETVNLYVNEIYGPVFQGEGASLGAPSIFLRLAGCNLTCNFCDSKYTWDWKNFDKDKEVRSMPVVDVASEIIKIDGAQLMPPNAAFVFNRIGLNVNMIPRVHLIITGGEPLLQQDGIVDLLKIFSGKFYFEIETAGTIAPKQDLIQRVDQWNVSPKLSSSGNRFDDAIKSQALLQFSNLRSSYFKFVVADTEKDFLEIDGLVKGYGMKNVYIMPEGMDAETILQRSREIAPLAVARGYHFTTRLHTLLYGSQRKV